MNELLRKYIEENKDFDTIIIPKEETLCMDMKFGCPIESSPKEISSSNKNKTNININKNKNTKNKVKAIRDICNLTEDTACFEIEETYVKGMNLDDYINNHLEEHNNFQKTLFSMIDERGLTDSEVYNKVNISRKLFSKIRTDNEYHPSRETVILLGLSLELSLDDMLKLLDSASYSLAKNNAFDLIIRFSCHSHIYDLDSVNEMLDEYSCKLLNC